jgi:hypothetical protein
MPTNQKVIGDSLTGRSSLERSARPPGTVCAKAGALPEHFAWGLGVRFGFRNANDVGLTWGGISQEIGTAELYLVYLINQERENGSLKKYIPM